MHLFPQLWWERHKWHCGWRKGPGNRQRSPYLGKYPNQSPKTDKQAFASGWSWVGITEVFLCCVNLSLTQKELECERDLRIEENICFKVQKQESKCLPLSLGQLGRRSWGKLVWTCRLRKSWSASEAKIERVRVILQSETEPLAANDLYCELRIWAYTWTFWNLNKLPFLLNTTPYIGGILFSNFVLISHIFTPLSLCDIIKHCRTAQISPCVSKCVELGALRKKTVLFSNKAL